MTGTGDVTGVPRVVQPPGMTGVDPLTAPLTYPGVPPRRPAVLVTDAQVIGLQPLRDAPLGEWTLRLRAGAEASGTNSGTNTGTTAADKADASDAYGTGAEAGDAGVNGTGPGDADANGTGARGRSGGQDVPLDWFLRNAGGTLALSRIPVLAVGSNASPAQVRRKMANARLPTLVPITAVNVRGLAVGISAHISRPGYLPATPVPDAGAVSNLWVVWLDADALRAMDATEPNYQRIRLSSRYAVQLTPGRPVAGCWVYVSRHGYLLNAAGDPRRLTDQATLITALLAEIPALPPLAGTTPQEWIERTRDTGIRNTVREVFRRAGLVRRPTGF